DWGLGVGGDEEDEGDIPITHYPLPMPNAPCPMPHAPCPLLLQNSIEFNFTLQALAL
ncbi:hypothetical protein IQ278_27060, partial [Tolypothrix sp. LEGE 11397]|nr:hypothetical protein [Tolypothrix sp. LEGE 11397]